MTRRILAILAIYLATCVAWAALAIVIQHRTQVTRSELRHQVADLCGDEHHTMAPEIYWEKQEASAPDDGKYPKGASNDYHEMVPGRVMVVLESSDISVDIGLDQRKKGLLWYSTYRVGFSGEYTVKNPGSEPREYTIRFNFPTTRAIYDNFVFRIDGRDASLETANDGYVTSNVLLAPGEVKDFTIAYDSRGLDRWFYTLGKGVSQVKDFDLCMVTDFDEVDFPPGTIAPTARTRTSNGWELVWHYDNLISGFELGMEMPKRVDPGPLAGQITLFAPISLMFFFFITFILSVLRSIKVHPMNYFFLAAAFFAFHLLFAYLVDHIDIHLAFVVSSLVSVSLVTSYLRLVVGPKFAFREAALAQFIYLVLFSYAHFFKGLTGLTVTVGAIVTLAVLMQVTGRIDWEERFKS